MDAALKRRGSKRFGRIFFAGSLRLTAKKTAAANVLRTIYHSVFNSHLIYACEIGGLRIIDFKPQTSPSDCIFEKIRFLRSLTSWNTNMPCCFLENAVIFNNNYVYSTKPKLRSQHSCCYKPSSWYTSRANVSLWDLLHGIYSFKNMKSNIIQRPVILWISCIQENHISRIFQQVWKW